MSNRVYTLSICGSNVEGIYRVGEQICFYPQVKVNYSMVLEGTITWTLLKNGFSIVAKGEFPLDTIGAGVETVAEEPCCLECRMEYHPPDGVASVSAELGAAVDPFSIRQGIPAPADFDEFWNRQKERLTAVPMKSSLVRLTSKRFECFDVTVDCVDNVPVSGLLAIPASSQQGKTYPALISLHGSGTRSAEISGTFPFVEQGFMMFNINSKGLPNLHSPEFYAEKRHRPDSYWFETGQPERVYFVNMFLRVKRAIEFIAACPQWNGRDLILFGGSLGGFQSLAGAYLDSRVSAIAVSEPAGCDLSGVAVGRRSGGPLGDFSRFEKSVHDLVLKACGYFDTVNFASRIKVPGRFVVGLVDGACSPCTVYAAYNNYAGPKSIITAPWMGHASEPWPWRDLIRFALDQATR